MNDFIELTFKEGEKLWLKIKNIESMTEKYDCSLTRINSCSGKELYIVKESPQEIIDKIEEYKKQKEIYEPCINCGIGAVLVRRK